MDELYIGLMSGTSCDGIDACLVRLSKDHFQLQDKLFQPYPDEIKVKLAKLIKEQTTSLSELSKLDHDLAAYNALVVKKLLSQSSTPASYIKAIGYHGQTIYHCPEEEIKNSLQIGDANFLAARTGVCVVADFRRMDMAVGGEGAPMVPGFHDFLFRDDTESRAILNIGGIANLTVLPVSKSEPVTGFDTGPGNCLMNEWMLHHQNLDYDAQGQWAADGQLLPELLGKLLADPYFSKPIPKSTGREYFNQQWLNSFLNGNENIQDVQTTLCDLTVLSISNAIKRLPIKINHVFVCGGGAHNDFLMTQLKKYLGNIQLDTTEVLGLHPDWVEACAFAWLARQRLHNQTGNIPGVTGANRAVICGAIYQV